MARVQKAEIEEDKSQAWESWEAASESLSYLGLLSHPLLLITITSCRLTNTCPISSAVTPGKIKSFGQC